MSDDNLINIGDFKKKEREDDSVDESEKESRIIDRIMSEVEGEEETPYTRYKQGAAQMVVEFLAQDIHTWEDNNDKELCSWDYKDIFARAIGIIEEKEREQIEEELSKKSPEELQILLEEEIEKLAEFLSESGEPEGED